MFPILAGHAEAACGMVNTAARWAAQMLELKGMPANPKVLNESNTCCALRMSEAVVTVRNPTGRNQGGEARRNGSNGPQAIVGWINGSKDGSCGRDICSRNHGACRGHNPQQALLQSPSTPRQSSFSSVLLNNWGLKLINFSNTAHEFRKIGGCPELGLLYEVLTGMDANGVPLVRKSKDFC